MSEDLREREKEKKDAGCRRGQESRQVKQEMDREKGMAVREREKAV